ncbi:MAG: BRCT domain-containing protein [Candidatus Caldatribacteriota bacterium]|nr:hypothetical protein [Patescibacteria group bacterium]
MEKYTFEDLNELEKQLEVCLEKYELGEPIISDNDYDHYKRILQKFRPNSYFLQKIGNKPKKNKEELPYILGSLTNKFKDTINSWLTKYDNSKGYILSHKLDGVAIECEYTSGILTNAWLRGDHYIGENITEKVKRFAPVFKTNAFCSDKCYFKAEALLNCDPATLGYKTKRNGIAGILNRDDFDKLKYLYLVFHTIVPNQYLIDINILYESERLAFISLLFDKENIVRFEFAKNPKEVIEIAEKMINEETFYDKDGIVITYEESDVENVKLPEKKVAFKFNKLSARAEVENVEWNTSRTGKIIPVVKIKPVDLGGATIQRASGFHAKYIYDNEIWPGAIIEIVRSGDVIPYIENIITPGKSEHNELISCPSCGNTDLVSDEINVYCNNLNCPAQVQKKITYFLEKLGLENFSEKMISSLNCKSIIDIYNLKKEDILKIDGWAEKSATDFLYRINQTKKARPEKILAALGIDNLGTTTSKLILEHFKLNNLISSLDDKNLLNEIIFKLAQIKGLGKKKIISIIKGLKSNKDLLLEFEKLGFSFEIKTNGILSGKSFCITGSLSKPRKDFEQIIEKYGGTNTSISSCNYLICNNPSDSNKFKKAQEKGIKIINEQELVKLIKGEIT